MASKLRSIQKGHKGAVTRLLSKFETIQREAVDYEELQTIENSLRQKQQTITEIHEKILDSIPEDEEEQIETEILDHDEYIYTLQTKIQKISSFKKVTLSNLNVNSPAFRVSISGESSQTSHDNLENASQHIPTHSHSSVYNRLPKLDLQKFDGNILDWQSFWDSYESAIHTNPSLSGVQKFNYLKSSLRAEAMQTIAGFALTNTNYDKAVLLLHERYGQKDKIIQTYMKALLEVPAPVYTVTSLRKFYDTTVTYIRGLDSLNQSESTYGSLLTPVILQKLPPEVRTNITRAHGTLSWCLNDLMQCLLNEVNILDAGNTLKTPQDVFATATFLTKSDTRKPDRKSAPRSNVNYTKVKTCVYCKGMHLSTDCVKVKDREQRLCIVKEKQLCFNCLGNHKVTDCKSRFKCKVCSRKHHTSLCGGESTVKPTEESSDTHNAKKSHTSVLHSAHTFVSGPVLLKTAVSMVTASSTTTSANILFDEGSQSSFVTEHLAQKLQLQPTGSETLCLSGFEDRERRVRHLDTATIYLQTSKYNIPIKVLIVPEISVPLKTYQKHVGHHTYLKGLKLAHPMSADEDFEIEILVGADHYWDVVQDKVIRGNGPTAIQSRIGYLLSGPLNTKNQEQSSPLPVSMMNVMTMHVLEEVNLEQFWEIESSGLEQNKNADYDEYTRQYQETCISYDNEQYVAKLPWKDNHPSLPSNELISRRRTENVINRLRKEPELLQKYNEIITEQENREFIEKIADDRSNVGVKVHYIPHHPVKKDSATTPIRIVYDCSCKSTRNSPSLNDCLMSTPPQLNDLTAILLRFRYHMFAVSTDIEKAFLNISLHPDDRDVTRFFWLSDPTNPDSALQAYRFKSILFGATCSPFILNATIMKHLNLYPHNVAERIKEGLYVDNILTSIPDEPTLLDFYTNSRNLFQQASFNLRSWSTNNTVLRKNIKFDGVSDKDKITKVLGMRWNSITDELLFPQRVKSTLNDSLLTKREILKESSSIYDPLGLLSPITVKGKILMQLLWKRKFEWDEVLPENIITEWCKIREDIAKATGTTFSRRYFPTFTPTDVTLQIFTDVSTKAYGTCAYLVSRTHSTLIMAKNRVTPVKQLTVPKLELCAALTGAKLCRHITSTIKCNKVFLWSDSQIVLKWISSHKSQPLFVANRVKEIRELTDWFQWRYCPTDSNPADLLSRGLSYEKFRSNRLWMNGPDWLTDETTFPRSDFKVTTDDNIEIDTTNNINELAVLVTTQDNPGMLEIMEIQRFSSYCKLLRVTSYILRFINNCKNDLKVRGSLESHEINAAARQLIKHVQYRHYFDVKQYLFKSRRNNTSTPNLVRQLDLFLDDNKLIRCGGRIANAPLKDCTKFPYLLPSRDRLTDLIVMDAHITHMHSGIESTVTFLRQKFWIPCIRQRVRKTVRSCVTCRKVTGKPYQVPDPPPLPSDRLKHAPPFTVTGVDFTGALTVKTSGGDLQKAYICLFTCANTRAVHLETVPNMTLDSFILALRRFISRKAIPTIIMSDNAKAYIATAKVLKEEILGTHGITWKFIPQHAPWYGGWWERLIGITKTCIKKVLGKALVSMEVLQTIIAEVECIVNDRPLTHTSSDPSDEEPLTPSHLLYGRRITSPIYPDDKDPTIEDTSHDSVNKLYRFKSATLEHFWSRWKHEYLTSLREFHKMSGNHGDTVMNGDVVQIHDTSLPRNRWSIGVIEDVIVGKDGLIRAARVRSRRGITTRPIAKLYPLEVK